jgi:2-oxoglutarate/2-oxoacid ferredoxin oxidoreductase subunit beta
VTAVKLPPPPPPLVPPPPGAQPATASGLVKLTRKDFQTKNDVRWCPGCGDYAILATVQRLMPDLGVARENMVFVSGIGCAARFPYYMETYGMHTIHGRAPAVATGLKMTRPDLMVWVITGDGDSLAIGGNHTLHLIRRNVDIKVLMFNNRIYGLTKGQYSPASEQGKVTKSTPMGSIDHPVNPLAFAVGAGATFVARAVDTEAKGLIDVLTKAHQHKGTAYIEILQNCVVFNDGAWTDVRDDREKKPLSQLLLQDGKPMIYDGGKKGIGFDRATLRPFIVDLAAQPERMSEVLVHDEKDPSGLMAFVLAKMEYPEFPVPLGVFRMQAKASFDEMVQAQGAAALKKSGGPGDLKKLLFSGDLWTVGGGDAE